MRKSTQHRSKDSGELIQHSTVYDAIDRHLREHLKLFPSKGDLDEGEILHWHKDLAVFPVGAIEWAFDSWRRNGRFFPLYGDILDYCAAWAPPEKPGQCSQECRQRHGKGYHSNDINYLMKRYMQKSATLPNRALTDNEVEGIFRDLDTKRGGPPEWRSGH